MALLMASQARVEAPNQEERRCPMMLMMSNQLSLVLALQDAMVRLFEAA
jgi:hypothetical protein